MTLWRSALLIPVIIPLAPFARDPMQGPLYQRIAGITSMESRWPQPEAPICAAGLHALALVTRTPEEASRP